MNSTAFKPQVKPSNMCFIRYKLASGETRESQPLGDEETADRWRRLLLQDPEVVEAVLIPVELALAAAAKSVA